ncbi:hypothetical protein [Sedimentibacter sp. zth1]|uniref:hypothetical protein n=1 Tax=Sedimentibacter sp. zth1 TaxID=2816908 RepID=UPI001F5FDE67|nr:hypothetical protein [Sedimentibacter sp. zth1]
MTREFTKGNYKIDIFCDEFTIQYDIETDYSTLSDQENQCFSDLSNMTARFSNDEKDLKIPNLYYDELQVKNKVTQIAELLNINE